MEIKTKACIREYDVRLNDEEIDDIAAVLRNAPAALPEHAERFLNLLDNR